MMNSNTHVSDTSVQFARAAILATLLTSTLVVMLARPIRAQENGLIEGFGSRLGPANNRMLGGLSLSGYSGPFGLRISGALNLRYDDLMSQPIDPCHNKFPCTPNYDDSFGPAVDAWAYDADLIFAPFRKLPVLRAVVMGFSPYAFVGVGRAGVTPREGPDTSTTTVSYGLGAYRSLFQRLGISGEARFRRPVQGGNDLITVGRGSQWEYRFGMSIRLGSDGHHADSAASAATQLATGAPFDSSNIIAARRADSVAAAADAYKQAVERLLDGAEEMVGTTYRRGGIAEETGFDAAGFVQYLFRKQSIDLPGSAREIARMGSEVSLMDGALAPGDVMLFANDGTHVDHVAIYVGDARFVHATESGGGVRYDELGRGARGRWFFEHFVSARRLLDGRATQASASVDDSRDPPDRAPAPRPVTRQILR